MMKNTFKVLSWCVFLVLFYPSNGLAVAGDFKLKVAEKECPKEIDDSIRKTLQGSALQISDGAKPMFEIWFCKEISLASKPESSAKAMDAIKQSTMLGVISVSADTRDYKDNDLLAGLYTMRFALQPQDGNHLGTAEFLYFAVLVPAKKDLKFDGITDYKGLVKASREGTATDHPIILSLRPPSSSDASLPKLFEPAPEHKSVGVKIPARIAGTSETSSVTFELVYQGKGKI